MGVSGKCGEPLLYNKRKDIGEILQKYRNMKNMTSNQVINYYKNKNIMDFDIGSSQYYRLVNGEYNYHIESLLKALDILNLKLVIKPKQK